MGPNQGVGANSWHRANSRRERRAARGVSAVEPEQQPTAGCERFSHRPGVGDGRERVPNNEPRKIKTLAEKGDAAENGGVPADATAPVAKPAAAAPAPEPAAQTRIAATNPVQTVPSADGGYLVQVSSQKNEADAQASYRALQTKFPSVLGSRSPVIKRVDLGDKGVYYRAMVGPFGTPEEAAQFCGKLKTAGGQCVVQRN